MDKHQDYCPSNDEQLWSSKRPKLCINELVEGTVAAKDVTVKSVYLLPTSVQHKPIKVNFLFKSISDQIIH